MIGHKSAVSCVSISFDNTKIISSSYDNTIKLWNFADGVNIRTF